MKNKIDLNGASIAISGGNGTIMLRLEKGFDVQGVVWPAPSSGSVTAAQYTRVQTFVNGKLAQDWGDATHPAGTQIDNYNQSVGINSFSTLNGQLYIPVAFHGLQNADLKNNSGIPYDGSVVWDAYIVITVAGATNPSWTSNAKQYGPDLPSFRKGGAMRRVVQSTMEVISSLKQVLDKIPLGAQETGHQNFHSAWPVKGSGNLTEWDYVNNNTTKMKLSAQDLATIQSQGKTVQPTAYFSMPLITYEDGYSDPINLSGLSSGGNQFVLQTISDTAETLNVLMEFTGPVS